MPRKGESKEFCKRGHPRTAENLAGRACRKCKQIIQRERDKTEEGRRIRKESRTRNRDIHKASSAKWYEKIKDDPVYKAKISEYTKKWRKEHPEQYKEQSRRAKEKSQITGKGRSYMKYCVDNLTDNYVRLALRLKKDETPQPLIEIKRLHLQLKREIKQWKQSKLSTI